MKTIIRISLIVYTLFFGSGTLFAVGEKTVVLGSASGWDLMEQRTGVIEVPALRPHPVLALSSTRVLPAAGTVSNSALDMALTFDEGKPELFRDEAGHYLVVAGPDLKAADSRWAHSGAGAALFTGGSAGGSAQPLTAYPRSGALLSPGYAGDFSLEFWLYPQNMENGEQILAWTSSSPAGKGDYVFQRIQCTAVRNRLQWTFQDFFSSPGGERRVSITFNGSSPLVPQSWSHHLIRFDADMGLLEYLVNGKTEAITHTTASGREGGEVYIPSIGEEGALVLGSRFMGLMDEFKIYSRYVTALNLGKYPSGGRVESRYIDLGDINSSVLKVDVSGGRASITGQKTRNEYVNSGNLNFLDHAALQFFIRAADSPYFWTDDDWRPFAPGAALPADLRGRFVQVAADFYPSGNGESTPYLDELRIIYRNIGPPVPPTLVTALARDGTVDLSWRASPDRTVEGYLIYYGTSPGEYFGSHAVQGASPIDTGNRTSLRIEGLNNGTLYYFAVSAYDRLDPYHSGEFSREVSARPRRMAE